MTEPFIMLTKAVARRPDLTAATKLVYGAIRDRMNGEGVAWPGFRTIATDTGCHVETVGRAVKQLESARLLLVEHRPFSESNRYTLPQNPSARATRAPAKPGRSEKVGCGARKKPTRAPAKPEHNETYPLNETQGKRTQAYSRKPDLIWETVCDVFRLRPVTKDDCKRVGKVVRDLKAKGATPDQIKVRVDRYHHEWPKVECSPEAVVKWWDRFAEDKPHGNQSANAARVAAPPGKYASG